MRTHARTDLLVLRVRGAHEHRVVDVAQLPSGLKFARNCVAKELRRGEAGLGRGVLYLFSTNAESFLTAFGRRLIRKNTCAGHSKKQIHTRMLAQVSQHNKKKKNLDSVLVGAREKDHFLATGAVEARQRVGQQRGEKVPDVRLGVDVKDGRRDVERPLRGTPAFRGGAGAGGGGCGGRGGFFFCILGAAVTTTR